MVQKLMIDADPGIGDALAVLLALLDPELDVVALTAVRACVTGLQAGRNLQTLLETLDPLKWPRLGVAEPIGEQEEEPWAESSAARPFCDVHGRYGLGDWPACVADLHHPLESAKVLCDFVRTYPGEVQLLCLGPLTNVALAIKRDPEFLSKLGGLVCLGGTYEAPGDVTPTASVNCYLDPEAARMVLTAPVRKTVVPLDAARTIHLGFEGLDRLAFSERTPTGRLLHSLLPYTLRAHHQLLGLEAAPLQELAALSVVARPELFERSPAWVDVELEGRLTRGMTVFDRRGLQPQPNVDVVRRIDSQGVWDYLTTMLREHC